MRKMWAVVKVDGGLKVVELETAKSRKTIEREIKERFEVKLMMTKPMIERIQGMSIYEFAKKYGEKGFTFDVLESVKGVDLSERKRV